MSYRLSLRDLAFPAIVLLLLGVDGALQLRVRSMAERIAYLEETRGPQKGGTLSSLEGQDLDGNPLHIALASEKRPSLLLVYSPICSHCEKNLGQWKSLLANKSDSTPILVDVTGRMTRADVARLQLPSITQAIRLSSTSRLESNFAVTPTTLVVSADGRVRQVALGELDSSEVSALRDSLLN